MKYLLILLPFVASIDTKIREGLEKRLSFGKYVAPSRERNGIFIKNIGIQNPNVLYPKKKNHLTSLDGFNFSKDASLMAYQLPEGDSAWRRVVIMHVTNKQIPDDTLADIEFSTLSWKGNEGVFYSKYDGRYNYSKHDSSLPKKTEASELHFHQLGTPQSEDKIISEGQK